MPAAASAVGDRPDLLAVPQADVEDRDVEAAGLDMAERLLDRFRSWRRPVAERLEEILEHHRDQRLVLDDQDRSHGPRHRIRP